ncbi:hypothetical protein LSH36_314g00041 [Paralvinella palmiformis]|uniref:Uncharacterized protein n=1 Tax=Paralvinella palmiformis TaxID=53620 RepID=A0AAD9JHT4_9ANNE|nr:hypothetical protein LSH36_314g00041 [Paralvinella palmiformis]
MKAKERGGRPLNILSNRLSTADATTQGDNKFPTEVLREDVVDYRVDHGIDEDQDMPDEQQRSVGDPVRQIAIVTDQQVDVERDPADGEHQHDDGRHLGHVTDVLRDAVSGLPQMADDG